MKHVACDILGDTGELRAHLPAAWHAEARDMLRWLFIDWSIIGASWYCMSTINNIFVMVGGILVVANRMHALGVILHDACHRAAGNKTAAWWFVEILAGWTIGSTTAAMRYHHIRHHRASGTRLDPYRHPLLLRGRHCHLLLALRGAALPFWWSLRAFVAPIALLCPGLRTAYAKLFLQDRSGENLREHAEVIACARADLLQASAHCAGAAVVILQQLPFLTHYLLPWMLAGVLNAQRVIVEHTTEELDAGSDAIAGSHTARAAMLANTHTHNPGRVVASFLYPHNIGFHQAHHLFPTVSFVHLPAIHAALASRMVLPPASGVRA